MENDSYTGKLYFVGSADILDFSDFYFDDSCGIIKFAFDCEESRSGPYGHEGIATKANGSAYITDYFDPYENAKSVRLKFESERITFLRDDEGQQFLYVQGVWMQGRPTKRLFHGLLALRGGSDARHHRHQTSNPARNFEYRGDVYFVGSQDVLKVRAFHFEKDLGLMRIASSLQTSKSEPYSVDEVAKKSSGSAYLTKPFNLYDVPDSTVQLEFDPVQLLFLDDNSGRRYLHLGAIWHEGPSAWPMHGLLQTYSSLPHAGAHHSSETRI